MKTFVTAFVFLISVAAVAGEYPCYRNAVSFISVPPDRPSLMTLEARRVVSIQGSEMVYNLGNKTITIEAASAASIRFLLEVKHGRCSATEQTVLEPDRISPFNDHYKAVVPH